MVKVCVLRQQNANASAKENVLLIALYTFDLLNRLCSVCSSLTIAKTYNYYIDQTELLTRFRTDFTSSVWNFSRSGAGIPPGEGGNELKRHVLFFFRNRNSHSDSA